MILNQFLRCQFTTKNKQLEHLQSAFKPVANTKHTPTYDQTQYCWRMVTMNLVIIKLLLMKRF